MNERQTDRSVCVSGRWSLVFRDRPEVRLDFSMCDTKLNQGEIAPSLQTHQLLFRPKQTTVKC